MNIFVSYPCPKMSARYLDDKRVVKMVLETTQILSTAIHLAGGKGPYKVTHQNHPCCKWARETSANYVWLLDHLKSLMKEYTSRYGRKHKCEEYMKILEEGVWLMKDGPKTVWPNCTIFKEDQDNIHSIYRRALDTKWKQDVRTPTWYGCSKSKPRTVIKKRNDHREMTIGFMKEL